MGDSPISEGEIEGGPTQKTAIIRGGLRRKIEYPQRNGWHIANHFY